MSLDTSSLDDSQWLASWSMDAFTLAGFHALLGVRGGFLPCCHNFFTLKHNVDLSDGFRP